MEPIARLLWVDAATWWFALASGGAVLASWWDVRWFRIPNWLTFSMIGIGLIGHTVLPSSIGWVGSVAGSVFGLIVMMPLFARGGLGAGDVKLLGGIGACIGLHDAVAVFMMFGLLAGGLATALLLAQGRRPSMAAYGERIEDAVRLADPVRRKRVLPLAPWMATAMLVLAAGSLWRW